MAVAEIAAVVFALVIIVGRRERNLKSNCDH
jgi:hypothetical protein